ncbi:hypothetical protein [Hyphomicrobium sp.]|uniref:hypothetical protein n=1 Tax=Hyphomicrobium sp. TaxID=82 RepID=UPI001D38E4FF|nr:hypothetical protein [Hyphomicrobium sp.]MBY0559877.1 hypothetical protein [Hyphomicrobium sp.]
MADVEVRVTASGAGFDAIAAGAERAEVALKNMGAAARGATSTNSAAATEEAAKINALANATRNGLVTRANEIGTQMRQGIAKALTDNSFWNRTFNDLKGRFKALGQQLNKELTTAMNINKKIDDKVYGEGKHASHTDLMYGAAVGYGAFEVVNKAVRSAADRESAKFQMNSIGTLSPDQQAALAATAQRLSGEKGNITTAEGIRFLASAIRIFGGPEHVFTNEGKGSTLTPEAIEGFNKIFSSMSYAKTYEEASGHHQDPEAIRNRFESAIRSGEIKGLGTDPVSIANWVDKLLRIQMATGVDPDRFLQAQQQAGVSFLTMDDDAIYGFAAMVQENRQRAGTMLRTSFMHQIAGNSQTVRGNNQMRDLGLFGDKANQERLIKEGKIEVGKEGGYTHIDPTIIPGYYENARNPYKWDAETFYPLIRNKIMEDTGEDIGDATKKPSERSLKEMTDILRNVGAAFKNPQEALQTAEAIIQYAQMQRRGENAKKALIDEKQAGDLFIRQLQNFSTQMTELGANLGEGVLPKLTNFLKGLNNVIKSTGQTLKEHPMLAKGLGLGLMGLAGMGAWSGLRLVGGMFKTPVADILKVVTWGYRFAKGLITGIGAAGAMSFGDQMAGLNLAKTEGSLAKLASNAGRFKSIFGLLGKITGLLGAGALAYDASQTEAGQAFTHSIAAGMRASLDPHNKYKQRAYELAHTDANNALRSVAGYGPLPPPPSSLESPWMRRMRSQFAHDQEWLQDLRPPRATFAAGRVGGKGLPSGPLPVIITNPQPQQPVPPPQVNVGGVTVTVNGDKNNAAIAGATGAAVQSKVGSALSDQHH